MGNVVSSTTTLAPAALTSVISSTTVLASAALTSALPVSASAFPGQWTTHIDFGVVPVAGAVLPDVTNGQPQVLVWSSYSPYQFGGEKGYTATAIWNMNSGKVTPRKVTQTNHDMFCPGINYDFDGALWVTGGGNAQVTSVYNVANDAWDRDDDLRIPRGYQSAVTVSDGNIFTIGGSYSGGRGGKIGERYDMNKGQWAKLPGCDVKPMLTADRGGVWRTDNHAWLFSWSDSWVFQAGPSNAMNWYDTKGQGNVVAAGLRNGAGGPDQMNGPAVMYDAGKIFTIGGAHDYSDSPAYSTANIIELSTPAVAPKVTWTGTGTYNRTLANSVVMPDGNIFVSGGQTYGKLFTDDNPVQTPEIFNTATKSFTTVARDPSPRTYHSIALLLPDATILTAGGGMCYDPKGNCPVKPADHFEGNVYRPPYLYNQDGSPAVRPVITNSPASANLGTTVQVTLDKLSVAPVFSLIRLGTVTHTVNTDQRRVVIPSKVLKSSTYTLQLPRDPGVLVPGYYHLFVVVGGVPSVSKTIKIRVP